MVQARGQNEERMGLKGAAVRAVIARIPQIRPLLIAYYQRRSLKGGWHDEHPFDRAHGVRTSGLIPGYLLAPGATAYGAAQPSIIVKALAAIPDLEECAFLDFGCGKGRPLLIAAQAGFQSVTGLEFSPTLAAEARRNATIFSSRNPGVTDIKVITGDALEYKLPPGPLVIFLYNSFEGALVAQLLNTIEESLRELPRDAYVIYYNPVYAQQFDDSPALERRFASQIPYDRDEIGYGPDPSDAVVIWQNRGNPHPRPPGTPDAPVTVVDPRWRAVVPETLGTVTG